MNFGDILAGSVDATARFLEGYQKGKEYREKAERDRRMHQLILQAIQHGDLQVSANYRPDQGLSYTVKPAKRTSSSTVPIDQQTLRQMVGMDLPQEEILARYTPQGIPYAGGGYVGVEPGRKLGPDETLGEEIVPLPEYANYYYNKDFLSRARAAGYEPSIKGFRRVEKKPIWRTARDRTRVRSRVIWDYLKTLDPNAERQFGKYLSRYSGVEGGTGIALRDFLRDHGVTGDDMAQWVKEIYGEDQARELFPEYFIEEQ